jgi:hypothetical protein
MVYSMYACEEREKAESIGPYCQQDGQQAVAVGFALRYAVWNATAQNTGKFDDEILNISSFLLFMIAHVHEHMRMCWWTCTQIYMMAQTVQGIHPHGTVSVSSYFNFRQALRHFAWFFGALAWYRKNIDRTALTWGNILRHHTTAMGFRVTLVGILAACPLVGQISSKISIMWNLATDSQMACSTLCHGLNVANQAPKVGDNFTQRWKGLTDSDSDSDSDSGLCPIDRQSTNLKI